jgi:hypothetical protein
MQRLKQYKAILKALSHKDKTIYKNGILILTVAGENDFFCKLKIARLEKAV